MNILDFETFYIQMFSRAYKHVPINFILSRGLMPCKLAACVAYVSREALANARVQVTYTPSRTLHIAQVAGSAYICAFRSQHVFTVRLVDVWSVWIITRGTMAYIQWKQKRSIVRHEKAFIGERQSRLTLGAVCAKPLGHLRLPWP
jgi:hypothetical protein